MNADSNQGFATSPRATDRLVIKERTTTKTRNNDCVLTSVSCVMAVIRLGELQQRLVPFRVQKLLVEQDAVDVLHCLWVDTKRLFGPEHGDECSVDHRVSHVILSPFVQPKKVPKLFQTGFCDHFPEFGGLLRGPGYFGPEMEVEIKNPGWQSFCPPWS